MPFEYNGLWEADEDIHFQWQRRTRKTLPYTYLQTRNQSRSSLGMGMGMWSIPSSGSMVRVKFRMSSGLGKEILMVLGRESSVKSVCCG